MKKILPIIFTSLSLPLSIHAWQDSFEGPDHNWEASPNTTLAVVRQEVGIPAEAVSDGQQCLMLSGSKGHAWNQLAIRKDLLSKIKSSTSLSFDVYVPEESLPATGWAKIQVRIYGGQGNSADFDITSELELDLNAEGGKSYHFSWDYAADPAFDQDIYWGHIGIVSIASGGSMAPIYIDNMQLFNANELDAELQTDAFLLSDKWELIWNDEFEGKKGDAPAEHWRPGAIWRADGTWRDSTLAPEEAYLDGRGNLTMRTRYENGKRLAPYLVTSEKDTYSKDDSITFGPGEEGIYIEWRANVSQFKAHAAWFALWLFSDNPYTGDAALGSEIDVMEYVPFKGPNYSLMNKFNAAIHIRDGGKSVQPPQPHGLVSFDEKVWNTWGLYWTKDIQVYYLNGEPYWVNRNKDYISTDDTHGIRLTIEIANGDPANGNKNHWGHAVGRFEDNPESRLPSFAYVDYVRVYRKLAE
ncbi:hypothetical protein QEH59_05535 [Coraliomargarita sp. SDUM461004]|uniref:GH16 domain-containing protein n=1 Tax=Thalassobacterium sedimentorum TaxID=3041258 RepID=A0ABU1AGG2_9BACT|nr:hypothetical protein [Coraliomargarita sp. SDUM461004]MDQ8193875.1 hypothetical protein [Coraliomargarita sp. SDUM461004]